MNKIRERFSSHKQSDKSYGKGGVVSLVHHKAEAFKLTPYMHADLDTLGLPKIYASDEDITCSKRSSCSLS